MSVQVVSIEEGVFDTTLGITTDDVTLSDGTFSIKGEGVVWDNFTEEEMEVFFQEWLILAKEGEDGYFFV